jgi:hypothetical protein
MKAESIGLIYKIDDAYCLVKVNVSADNAILTGIIIAFKRFETELLIRYCKYRIASGFYSVFSGTNV